MSPPATLSVTVDAAGSCDVVEGPSEEAVRDAVRSLDGDARSELSLTIADRQLLIGGGPLLYLAAFVDYDGSIHELVSDETSDGATVVLGGQPTDLAGTHLFPQPVIVGLALDFLRSGTRPEGPWERK